MGGGREEIGLCLEHLLCAGPYAACFTSSSPKFLPSFCRGGDCDRERLGPFSRYLCVTRWLFSEHHPSTDSCLPDITTWHSHGRPQITASESEALVTSGLSCCLQWNLPAPPHQNDPWPSPPSGLPASPGLRLLACSLATCQSLARTAAMFSEHKFAQVLSSIK